MRSWEEYTRLGAEEEWLSVKIRRYPCVVSREIDGDTIRLDWLLTDTLVWKNQRCRLARINTPELHDPDPLKQARAKQALARVQSLAPPGALVQVETAWLQDNYGRVLITLYPADGGTTSVNDILLAEGLADPYPLATINGNPVEGV